MGSEPPERIGPRRDAGRVVGPAIARAPSPLLAIAPTPATTESYRGEGRTLDLLDATPPADMRAAMWAAMARAHHASREVREVDGLASAPILDLREDLAIMAAAQRGSRRTGMCNGGSEGFAPCTPPTCCGQGAILSVSDEMALLASVPHDVLFGLQLRASPDPQPSARAADDRGPAKAGDDDPDANALVVTAALPP